MLFQTSWTECLHGSGSFRDCLAELCDLFDARLVRVVRICERTGRQRTIASIDRGAPRGERPLTSAIGPSLFASSRSQVRLGTVWTISDLDGSAGEVLDDRAVRWMADRGIRDVAAIPLDRSATELDAIELHFATRLSGDHRAYLEIVAAAASGAWRRRQRGRIARVLSAAPAIADRLALGVAPGQPALSASNPFRLTAAETRICSMVQTGRSTTDIMRDLRISESTLRTHLRSIYSKTGVAGQVDLVRVLLGEALGAVRLPEAG